VEHWPALITVQESLDALPATAFTMLLQHEQRVVTGLLKSPATVGVPRQTDKSMQKVISGIRV
tara:strand:- start:2219 stop:2407 length:189 start_codon:yes stop_codon:yes gene_type:complete